MCVIDRKRRLLGLTDANGNMITRNGASVGWRSDNLPSVSNAAGYSTQFDYAPDGQRWRQVSNYASGNETTIYVAGLLEKLTTPVCARIRGSVDQGLKPTSCAALQPFYLATQFGHLRLERGHPVCQRAGVDAGRPL